MKKRRILSGLLALSIIAVLSGCNKTVAKDDKALSYLEKKYGTEFVIDGYQNSDNGKDVDRAKMLAHAVNNKNKFFTVERVKIGTSTKITYEDDYFCRLVEPLYDQKIKDDLGKDFPDAKSAVHVEGMEYQEFENYKNKSDYDRFIRDDSINKKTEVSFVVKCEDNFDKNAMAEKINSLMQKLVDDLKKENSKVVVEAAFYLVKSNNYNKVNPEVISTRESRQEVDSKWVSENKDTTEKYIIASFGLTSYDKFDTSEILKHMQYIR
ncbi:hypothetical protein KYB31_23425 [Clostridium felsineum]|uniref:hypothetical protein n=1 Tax=Clostridium felsineum TaxID=36839 RepID=UPI00214D90AA|nr:hypothetical protein [Clostridium felsineum]MCR3761926.1 hypothetical protein [Clostridium felsineum]